MQLFQENRHFIFQALVILKLLISLTIHFVAHSTEISIHTDADRQTDRQIHRQSTITLTVHASRGLLKVYSVQMKTGDH